MFRNVILITLLLIVPTISPAQVAKELIGKYQMNVKGGVILELRANGTASMAGDETEWSSSGNQLSIGPNVMQYVLQGERLVLSMNSVQITWKKIGGEGKKSSPMSSTQKPMNPTQGVSAPPDSEASGVEPDEQAKQVLTNTAWCSFTYNKVSGTSTTRKVVFRRDGVMTVNGGAETYSSGIGGAYAGQSINSNVMKWKLKNLQLFVDKGNGYQDIGLTATKNSNGYIILHAEGREYSMCK